MTLRGVLRPLRSFRPVLQSSSIPSRRWASTAETNIHREFYKTFTRPVAKCLLLAMFTYQLAYYAWVKLETDEIREERQEVASLEEQVKDLQSKAATTTKS